MKCAFLGLLALTSLVSGCATVSPVGGALYSDVLGPVATTHLPRGPLKGEACAVSWLGLYATGDASAAQAARNSGISVISHIDQHSSNLLFIKSTYCSVVYGYKSK